MDRVMDLSEQLLTRLLTDNLDKVGENKEGDAILKNLNSAMLRTLENCNHTYVLCVLIDLQRKYKDYASMPRLPSLIVKCLLKSSKIIEKVIDKLDIEKILLSIHEYLLVINHESKSPNDEQGIKIVKTVLNEIVKLKRDAVWDSYAVIKCHGKPDSHIHRWIDSILKSLRGVGTSSEGTSTGTAQSAGISTKIEAEINQIVADLRNPEKFEATLPKLVKILNDHPELKLDNYTQQCSVTFQRFIKTNVESFRSLAVPSGQRSEPERQSEVSSFPAQYQNPQDLGFSGNYAQS
jgi:hypothetical protein